MDPRIDGIPALRDEEWRLRDEELTRGDWTKSSGTTSYGCSRVPERAGARNVNVRESR